MTARSARAKFTALALFTAAISLTLVACSGASPNETPDATAAAEAGPPETTELTVGVTPVGDFAPLYYAVSEGIFEEHGLTVTIDPKGASEVPPLLANSYQAVSMSWTTFIQAVAQGVPVRGVFPGIDGEANTQTGIYVMPDSGLTSAADLVGKTIAINQPKAGMELNSRVALEDADIDPVDVVFQVLPLPTMVDALTTDKVDASYLVPPFSTQAEEQGATMIVDAYADSLEGTPVAGFVMTAEFVAQNPNTVAAFQAALSDAAEILSADADLYREFITSYTQLTPELAQQVPPYTFPTSIDDGKLQQLADIMFDNEFSTAEITVSDNIVQPAG